MSVADIEESVTELIYLSDLIVEMDKDFEDAHSHYLHMKDTCQKLRNAIHYSWNKIRLHSRPVEYKNFSDLSDDDKIYASRNTIEYEFNAETIRKISGLISEHHEKLSELESKLEMSEKEYEKAEREYLPLQTQRDKLQEQIYKVMEKIYQSSLLAVQS